MFPFLQNFVYESIKINLFLISHLLYDTLVGKNDYEEEIHMVEKTGVIFLLSGFLALTVSTGTTFANAEYESTLKQLSTMQQDKQIEEKLLESSAIQQLDAQLQRGELPQNHSFTHVNAAAVTTSSSDYLVEQEPNDEFDFADQLSYSKPTIGQLLPDYDIDFYKVTVPSDGLFAVAGETTTYEIDLLFVATEKYFNETGKLQFLGSEYDNEFEIQYYQAKAGTYYIPVLDYDEYSNEASDLYMIATAFVDNMAPAKPIVNPVDDNDAVITGKAEANSTVTVKNGSKVIATTKATSTGTFSAKLVVQKAGTKLTATTADGAKNISVATTVTVVDKTAPAKPTVNKVDNNDAVITGKAEVNSTVTVKNGNKVIATTVATTKGTFSAKIATQKAGTNLTVNAKDKVGNVSAPVSVTVFDVVAPAAPTINKVTNKDVKITGKAEANSTVNAKVGKILIGSAKADAKGNYSIKIKAQKSGTTIEVTAKDKAGNTSKKTTKTFSKK